MLAAQRAKRSTAGNKMSKLLNAEEEDEFYKTTYGGFDEEEEDNDYHSSQSDSDDVIDSDFSIDENDEMKSDEDGDDKPKRKKQGAITKAYKDPKLKGAKEIEKKPPPAKKPRIERPKEAPSSVQIYVSPERKSVRRSTAIKSEAAMSKQKIDAQKEKMLKELAVKKNVASIRRMTQEELLEEAKITERENMQSLANYQKLELEKKRQRSTKPVCQGPTIRYHSLTMPLIEELPMEPEVDVDSEEYTLQSSRVAEPKKPADLLLEEKCARTFITFTDDSTFDDMFPQQKTKPPSKAICPITKLPAKYFDPITQVPYANVQAFRCIREAYTKQLEAENKSNASLTGSSRRREKSGGGTPTVTVAS